MRKLSDFTAPELDMYRSLCNFTKDEACLFDFMASDHTQDETAELMNVSTSTVKRILRKVWSKVDRIKAWE